MPTVSLSGDLRCQRTLIVTAHGDTQGGEPPSLVRKLDIRRLIPQIQRIFEPETAGRSAESSGTLPPPSPTPTTSQPVDLVLYVNNVWITSACARENIEKILECFVQSQVRLTVCDIAKEPLAVEEDQVVFTPTLVKRNPLPRAWLIGDLSDHAAIMSLLDQSGVERRPA